MVLAFIQNLRGWEWLIILVVILLLFGGKRIPTLMHSLGRGIKSFKSGLHDAVDEIEKDDTKDSSDTQNKKA